MGYNSSNITVIAYNGDDLPALYVYYSDIPESVPTAAFGSPIIDIFYFTTTKTETRYDVGPIYQRCSCMVGAFGGPFANDKGELIGG